MSTILAAFFLALIISLLVTPIIGRLGKLLGAIDIPNQRKVHSRPIPRTGGVAIVIAFLGTLALARLISSEATRELLLDRQNLMILAGGITVFLAGLIDDFRRLRPWEKLCVQIIGGTLAYLAGLQIRCGFWGWLPGAQGFWPISYGLTLFWFLLFINAVNLIDGLDGLAAGITFFASLIMVPTLILTESYYLAAIFAALAGAILGFLRYNFNPAVIFLGDGGSYFLGYALAALSIMGSVKSSLGTAMLIPLVALGVPVFDTLLSPLRRFILGKSMFEPDKEHIHHRLLSLGLSKRRVVLFIYGITAILCILGIALANAHNTKLGILLAVLALGAVLLIRKVGYFDYFTSEKFYGWIKDITDVTGLSKDRRSFLSLQIDTHNSQTLEELWQNIIRALQMLEFDYGALFLQELAASKTTTRPLAERSEMGLPSQPDEAVFSGVVSSQREPMFHSWLGEQFDAGHHNPGVLRIELPLHQDAKLLLMKEMGQHGLHPSVLRRVEQLRRTIISTLTKLKEQKYESYNFIIEMPLVERRHVGKKLRV